MKYLTITLLFLTYSFSSLAQGYQLIDDDAADRDTTELEALPWFGNNQYLYNFLDSIGYSSTANRIVGPDRAKYRVPIKFWIYRKTDGTGGPNMQNLQNYIDNLNRVYNVENYTKIGFYMRCEVGVINDNDLFEIDGDGEAWNLIQNRKETGCINIHIVGDYERTAGIHIRARIFGRDGIVLNFGVTGTNANTTIAHEVGHYFELDHTHQYSSRGKCRKEPIDRNRTWPFFSFCPFGGGGPNSQKICESTGDLLSDTPADPDLTNNLFNNFGACTFNAQGSYSNVKDPWNDFYVSPPSGSLQPNPTNVMSYNRDRDCRIEFSTLQIAVMLYSIERGKSKNNKSFWKDSKAEYDEYEMDNFNEVARPILLGEVQERNFHQQYTDGGIWFQCDVDWVRFVPSCGGTYTVETTEMPDKTKANTKLTLFNSALNQLAQNDDISSSNHFSRLTYNFIVGQEYFIRIENMSQNVTGYYNFSIGNPFANPLSIAGNDNLCPSDNYLVSGLPAGATVSWNAWPLNMVSFSCTNCPEPTISREDNSNGIVTITATVSVSVCGTNFTKATSKQLYIGAPDHSNLLINSQYACAGNPVDLAVEFEDIGYCSLLTAGVTDVQWDIASPYPFQVEAYYSTLSCMEVSNSGRTINFSDGYGAYTVPIRVKVMNACGWSDWGAYFPLAVNDCGWGFKVSPNPSTGSMVVTLNETSLKNNKSMVIREIQITDKLGIIVKKYQFGTSTKSANLNIQDLKQDVYFIRVFNGKEWKSQSIIKK